MKKLKSNLITTILVFIFSACSVNEINQECFTCQETLTEYCIKEGDDFYTVSVNNAATINAPLDGEFWNDIKDEIETQCEILSQLDCFTCISESTQYCYIYGDDFYTLSLTAADDCDGDGTPDYLDTDPCESQINLNGQTWEEIKIELENSCPIN